MWSKNGNQSDLHFRDCARKPSTWSQKARLPTCQRKRWSLGRSLPTTSPQWRGILQRTKIVAWLTVTLRFVLSVPLRFQASGDAEIKTVPRHFARANQADRCITLVHCAQRLTPWLLDMRGCERKVECFSLFECYVTLPVGTWLIALDQSSRSQCGRLLRTLQSHYFVLREKKETFSVASLQLTVQLPCGNVFSSFILPLRACQRRSFHDVSTVGVGAERGVNNRQTNRSPQSLRWTKIRAWLP